MMEKKDEYSGKPLERRENPYKELDSYEEKDKEIFCGRTTETETLFQLVSSNSLSVVFGKSGIGKTSLLNAGLFPRLKEEGFLPIRLRLYYSTDGAPLMEQISQAIRDELKTREIKIQTRGKDEQAKPIAPDEKLWEYFHRASHFVPPKEGNEMQMVTPVLVFDQFEELFTLGKYHDDKDNLIDELYWLIEDQLPPPLKELEQKSEAEKKEFLFPFEPPDVRIIISLREDYLPHLTGLKSRIPSIDQNLFRVIHLNGTQAEEIINMPTGVRDKTITNAILRMFYPGKAKEIKEISREKLEVEPSILSVLCSQIFKDGSFTLKERGRILTAFYDSVMANFPGEVEEFIEDNLVNERGSRTLFLRETGHPLEKYFLQLEEKRILRKVHLGGKLYLEIIHDLLAEIVMEKRNIRMDEKRKQELRKELGQRFRRIGIGAGFFTLIILIFATWYSIKQKNIAEERYRNEKVNRLTAEALLEFPIDNTKAIRIAEAAYKLGLPSPPARTQKTLSDIGYSYFEKPFYIADMHHNGAVNTVVFSSKGSYLLTASDDGIARLWNIKGRKKLKEFKHTGRVASAVFSPDETRILTASWDRTAKVWDLQKEEILLNIKHDAVVTSAVYSPKGGHIITTARDGWVRVWDPAGEEKVRIKHDGVSSAVFSPDEARIITASWDNTAKVWGEKGEFLFPLEHENTVISAVYSPDGKQILTASERGALQLWTFDGKPVVNFTCKGRPASVSFSADGRKILAALRNGTITVWSPEERKISTEFKYDGELYSAAFSPDNLMIAAASPDGTAKVWNLKSDTFVNLIDYGMDVKTAVFSSDKEPRILTASVDGKAKIWGMDGKCLEEFPHKDMVSSAVFSPDSDKILVASGQRAILWTIEDRSKIYFSHPQGSVTSAVVSPDGENFLTTSVDHSAKVWEVDGEEAVGKLTLPHKGGVSFGAFSSDNLKIVTASTDGYATVWDMNGKRIMELKHMGRVSYAVFAPNNRQILTASSDGNATIWDMNGEQLLKLKHMGYVSSAVYSPDGRQILSTSHDGTVRLWDRQGNLLAIFDKHNSVVNSAIFSSRGDRVLSTSQNGTVKIFPTPKTIFGWLEKSGIPQLSVEGAERLGVHYDE